MMAADDGDLAMEFLRVVQDPPRFAFEGYLAPVRLWPALFDNHTHLGESLVRILDDHVDTFELYWFPFQDIQILFSQTDEVLEVPVAGANQLKAAADLVVDLATLDGECDYEV